MSDRHFLGDPRGHAKVKTWTPPCFDREEDAPVRPEDAELFEFKPFCTPEVVEEKTEFETARMTLEEARMEAGAILAGARAEADRLVKEAAEIKAAAHNAGLAEGLPKGREEGLAKGREESRLKFEAETAPAVQAFQRIESLYNDLWSVNEAAMVKLAIKIAERIVFHEVETSPETIVNAFQAALDTLHEQHDVVFRLHPHDLKTLENLKEDLRSRISGLVKVRLEPDEDLSRGDLVMDTESGRLDATLRRRIENVVGAVDEALAASFDLDW